ncbi:PspC domain-containing protein [Lysobacter hankyongensis]|uniref:PspC domain-containing protein n=1 Tax=Lysobacter hankyongensis TaxID=1176535 RepID=A0ABP9BTZ4_9GAMM
MAATRTLVRVRNDRVLAGVVGGIAARFGWNATLLRVVYVLVSALSAAFPGILVYLILWLLIPEEGAA